MAASSTGPDLGTKPGVELGRGTGPLYQQAVAAYQTPPATKSPA